MINYSNCNLQDFICHFIFHFFLKHVFIKIIVIYFQSSREIDETFIHIIAHSITRAINPLRKKAARKIVYIYMYIYIYALLIIDFELYIVLSPKISPL